MRRGEQRDAESDNSIVRLQDPPTRRLSRWGLPVVVLTNLLLGVPGILPVFLGAFLLQDWPAVWVGLTEPQFDEEERDMLLLIGLPVVGFAMLAWVLTGVLLRRRFFRRGAWWFWPVSFVAVIIPTPTFMAIVTAFNRAA